MAKTAKQLDREIATVLREGPRREWWLWRYGLSQRTTPQRKVMLRWAYDWKGLTLGTESSREDVAEVLKHKELGQLEHRVVKVFPRRFGSMRVVEVTGPSYKPQMHWLFTPPIYLFANLYKMRPDFKTHPDFKEGSPRFWIQPQIFAATGEIYQGDVQDLVDLSREDLIAAEPSVQDAADEVLVALDAFLTKGRPDPRFV